MVKGQASWEAETKTEAQSAGPGDAEAGGPRECHAGRAFSGERRDTRSCLLASPSAQGAVWMPRPRCPRTRGPAWTQDVGSGPKRSPAAAARPHPTWRAQLWHGENRSRAGGARGSGSRSLARSPALRLPPARLAAFNHGRPAPGPSSGPPSPASASLRTPTLLPALLGSWSCPSHGAETLGAPVLPWSRCLTGPFTPQPTHAASQKSGGKRARDRDGEVTEPRE